MHVQIKLVDLFEFKHPLGYSSIAFFINYYSINAVPEIEIDGAVADGKKKGTENKNLYHYFDRGRFNL